MLLSLVTLLALFVTPPDSLRADEEAQRGLEDAVARYTRPLDAGDGTAQRTAWADLNGDGRLDALVYLQGPSWCGSGGCTLLVMEAVAPEDAIEVGAFVPAAEISLMHGPILVLPATTASWRDLCLQDGDGQWRVLRFDGETYPFSPAGGESIRDVPTDGTLLLFADPQP